MKTYQEQSTTNVLALERQREELVERLTKLCDEPRRDVVENFLYWNPDDAVKARGQLMCQILAAIDEINRDICRVIAPGFAPIPSAGFSDRVMRGLVR